MHPQSRTTAAILRDRAFWLGAGVLVLGQLVAFWMLCVQQVRTAEVRNASAQEERLAVADCLRSVPNASRSTCVARVAPQSDQFAAATQGPADDHATPVNYVYH